MSFVKNGLILNSWALFALPHINSGDPSCREVETMKTFVSVGNLEIREIIPGLVLHMDPDTLTSMGATYTCAENRRVRGPHFFLCVGVCQDHSRWLPLYSKDGVDRMLLPRAGRTGHPKWTTAECHYHVDQMWLVTFDAVEAAAEAGEDRSSPARRNRLSKDKLPVF